MAASARAMATVLVRVMDVTRGASRGMAAMASVTRGAVVTRAVEVTATVPVRAASVATGIPVVVTATPVVATATVPAPAALAATGTPVVSDRDSRGGYGDRSGSRSSGGDRDSRGGYGDRGGRGDSRGGTGDRDSRGGYGQRDSRGGDRERGYGDRDRRDSFAGDRSERTERPERSERPEREFGSPRGFGDDGARRGFAEEDTRGGFGQREGGGAGFEGVNGEAREAEDVLEISPDATVDKLDKDIQDELARLLRSKATLVAGHLVMAGQNLDEDPELAYRHARTAMKLAPRLASTREAAGLAAYLTGRYSEALADLRTVRRITGTNDHWAVMADCERGLGRPERALAMAAAPEAKTLDKETQIELRMVAAGARMDMEQPEAAVVQLQGADLTPAKIQPWTARLRYAYAEALLAAEREDDAREWFMRAADADAEGLTDAAERVDELDGIAFDEFEDELDAEEGDRPRTPTKSLRSAGPGKPVTSRRTSRTTTRKSSTTRTTRTTTRRRTTAATTWTTTSKPRTPTTSTGPTTPTTATSTTPTTPGPTRTDDWPGQTRTDLDSGPD